MDDQSYELVQRHIPNNRMPFEKERYPIYMVIEIHHSGKQEEADEKLLNFLESRSKNIENGILARDAAQAKSIWNTREKIADAFVKEGVVFLPLF